MATKENATDRARIFPSTYRRIRVRAARSGITIAELIDQMERSTNPRIRKMQAWEVA